MDRRNVFRLVLAACPVLLSFCLAAPLFSASESGQKSTMDYEVPQGGILFFTPQDPEGKTFISVSCLDRVFPFLQPENSERPVALVAVDLFTEPSVATCNVKSKEGNGDRMVTSFRLRVVAGGFRTQELNVPRAMVDLDPPTLKRVRHEKKAVDALWEDSLPEKLWQGNFLLPVEGTPKGTFGLRRVFNGQPRSPHTGEDFSAPNGAEVLASNRGLVKLTGDHFFSGKSIFIDHGHGLYTMYFHLSEISVQEGQLVDKGALIGRVGSSGRATGPHLHWGVRLNNSRVDPLSLTRLPFAR